MENVCGVIREKDIASRDYQSLDRKIYNVLTKLGIPSRNRGFDYLHRSIKLAIEDPQSVMFITKILYRDLSKQFQTTPSAIERNLRTVIRSMPYTRYRATVFPDGSGHYTNKEFIMHIVHFLQYN